jgi:arabinofuranan 3-O-arabinosyltransferase
VSLREVTIPGLAPARPLLLPAVRAQDRARGPAPIVLRTARDGSDTCAYLGDRPLCGGQLATPSEDGALDRLVDVPAAGEYVLHGTARPRASAALDALLRPVGNALRAQSSSRRSLEPAERPQAAVDRDLGTTWVASEQDEQPRLTLTWRGRRTVRALQLQVDPAVEVSRATRVRVQVSGSGAGSSNIGGATVDVGADGWVRFLPQRGTRLEITVIGLEPRRSVDAVRGVTVLPFGISEVVVPELDALRRGPELTSRTSLPCGFGPPVRLDDLVLQTRADGTVGDILRRRPLRVRICLGGPLRLHDGLTRIRVDPNERLQPERLALLPAGFQRQGARAAAAVPAASSPVRTVWEPERRELALPASPTERVLVVHENASDGWRATLGDVRLTPLRLDGWQQAWLVPAGGAGTVVLEFTPGQTYRTGLVTGLALLLVLLVLATAPWRLAAALRRRTRQAPNADLPDRDARAADLRASDRPAVLEEARAPAALAALGALCLVAIGSWAAVVLAPVWALAGRSARAVRWTGMIAVAAAGAFTAADPSPRDAGPYAWASGVAACVALACLLVLLVRDRRALPVALPVPVPVPVPAREPARSGWPWRPEAPSVAEGRPERDPRAAAHRTNRRSRR